MKLLIVLMFTCTAVWAFPQSEPTHTSSEDLKMEARIDDELEDYGAPGFFSFHNGEPFTVEKDPVTGNLDFNKKETPDYGFYKEEIDRKDSKPKIPTYHTPNDIPSNPFKISAADSSPDLHQFLNLPVHYSTSGKFPLISSSYANMKVQGSAPSSSSSSVSGGSNHRHYTPSSSTTTSQPPSYYTSNTMRTTEASSQPTRTTSRPTMQPTKASTTTKTPSYRSTTSVPPTTTTTRTTTTTSTTTTTAAPPTRSTTTEKVQNKVVPQPVWNISEPVDYNPEEEISYVDYEYEPDLVNHQLSGYHEHNQAPVLGSNTKDSVIFNQKVGEFVQNQQQKEPVSNNKQSSTTTTTSAPQTSTKITRTTSKVSIVTSLPISTATNYPSSTTTTSSSLSNTKEQYVEKYSTSMPVTALDEAVRPGVGNTYLFSGQLGENVYQNNGNNFFRPPSNQESFKPMPSVNESYLYLNERPAPTKSQESEYDQRPLNRPEPVPAEEIYQNQKPLSSRPIVEINRQEPPFPFENNQQQQIYFQKPNKPMQVEQPRPEKPHFELNRPHTGQKHQQNVKQERPQKYPGPEPVKQEPPFQFEYNPYHAQNQYNKPERPNKYNQVVEPVQHQHFDPNMKHSQQFNKHSPIPDIQQQQIQYTAHLSTGPIGSGSVSQVKRPQNPNIHPSDLRPPPPPNYSQDDSEEEINFVKKPISSKPIKSSSNNKPPPITTSGGFVNIQPGKIQNIVPIRVPTEMDQNSQSYSLQTSFSIGASGEDNIRLPVAQGSVIDENINNINRSDLVPPPLPQRPQNIRTPPPLPPSRPVQHWESYTPHHYANNKVKTDAEVLKPSLPNILPQFRPNAKTGHVDPHTQYIDTRVKQPHEHLQPPPLPRPQYLRIDRNDEDIKEPMMHSAKQSMRVFQKPGANKVTTLQMMQQGQAPPGVPLKRIIRTENNPHHKMPKPNLEMKPQVISDKIDGKNPVHVVYPTTNQRLTPELEDVVVVGSHSSQRPSPPKNMPAIDENPFNLDDPIPFLLAERDRDTPVLKTKPIKPLKNDFPYSLVKDTDFLDMDVKETKLKKPIEESKITQEYTAFSPTESSNTKMDPDPELNVIPYLQDYSPYATRKPAHNKPISVTLKNILASSTPKPNLGMVERIEITPQVVKQKFNSGSHDITVGAVMDMNLGNHKTGGMINRYVPHFNETSENHRNSEKQSIGGVEPQDFLAPFQPSSSNPENQGWRVIGNTTREYPEERVESETTMKPSEFSFEQFKPQLFGGFKPIVASDSDEEELELDA